MYRQQEAEEHSEVKAVGGGARDAIGNLGIFVLRYRTPNRARALLRWASKGGVGLNLLDVYSRHSAVVAYVLPYPVYCCSLCTVL